ncbi:MAG: hypothetical protein ACREA0_05685, partial [bacterium]
VYLATPSGRGKEERSLFGKRREKRRMEKLARQVAPLLAESDRMAARDLALALRREVEEGSLKSDEDLRAELEEESTVQIETLLHHHTNALRLITGPEVFSIAVRAIRESLPLPSFIQVTALRESPELPSSTRDVEELARRMRPMVAILKQRKGSV